MEIYKNEFNHIIIKDDNENVCEQFGNRTLEEVKEDKTMPRRRIELLNVRNGNSAVN